MAAAAATMHGWWSLPSKKRGTSIGIGCLGIIGTIAKNEMKRNAIDCVYRVMFP